jgi:dGTP triphosphohydrolase
MDGIFGASDARDRAKRFTSGRTAVTTHLVKQAAEAFVGRLKLAKDGKLDVHKSLIDDEQGKLAIIKGVAKKRIYSSRIVMANEVTGFQVITGLLRSLQTLLKMNVAEFRTLCICFRDGDTLPKLVKHLTEEPGLLALFPRELLAAYLDGSESSSRELFLRAHLLVDFVVSMNDDAALRTYRLVSGQSLYASR